MSSNLVLRETDQVYFLQDVGHMVTGVTVTISYNEIEFSKKGKTCFVQEKQ